MFCLLTKKMMSLNYKTEYASRIFVFFQVFFGHIACPVGCTFGRWPLKSKSRQQITQGKTY